jgi:integrase/recombinase XerC
LPRKTRAVDSDERRDAAIVRLFLDSGLRRAELAGLRREDVDFLDKIVLVLGITA